MNFKEKIRKSFNKGSATYDEVSDVQEKNAEEIVKLLISSAIKPSSILDIGCGTGCLTKQLIGHFPYSQYTLNDISESMVEKCKEKFSLLNNVDYVVGDAENIEFKKHDFIVSNFALHWFFDLKKCITKFFDLGSVIAFSIPIKGTFLRWYEILKKLNITPPNINYKEYEEVESICLSLKPSKYSFLKRSYNLKFDSSMQIIKYIKKLGAGANNSNTSNLKELINYDVSDIIINYEVFFAILHK